MMRVSALRSVLAVLGKRLDVKAGDKSTVERHVLSNGLYVPQVSTKCTHPGHHGYLQIKREQYVPEPLYKRPPRTTVRSRPCSW